MLYVKTSVGLEMLRVFSEDAERAFYHSDTMRIIRILIEKQA